MAIEIKNNFELEWEGDLGCGDLEMKENNTKPSIAINFNKKEITFFTNIIIDPMEADLFNMHGVRLGKDPNGFGLPELLQYTKLLNEARRRFNIENFRLLKP
jgi:hypothetical protein